MRGIPITSVKGVFESSGDMSAASKKSILEEDLPPQSYTKNMLAKFQSMQDGAKASGGKMGVSNGDDAERDELPQQGTTKSLLAKFQNIEQESVSSLLTCLLLNKKLPCC